MSTFNSLLKLPRSAVYAVIDEKQRRVLVSYSTSLMASLGRLIERINTGEMPYRKLNPYNRLKFVVLEKDECRNRLMVRTGFHMQEFKKQGYSLVVDVPPATYVLKSVLLYTGLNAGHRSEAKIQAVLVSKRNSKIIVGEFKTQAEYDAFARLHYRNGKVYDIVYDVSVLRS